MSSMVKLGTPSRTGSYLGIPAGSHEHIIVSGDMMTIRLRAGNVQAIGGKRDGEILEDRVVEANQQVVIFSPVVLKPMRYHTFLSANPELFYKGLVCHPNIVEPGATTDILISFKANKRTDLNDFAYIFALNMID